MCKEHNFENKELSYHTTDIIISDKNGLVEVIDDVFAFPYIINFPYKDFKKICQEFLKVEDVEEDENSFMILFPASLDKRLLKSLLKNAELICIAAVRNLFIVCRKQEEYNEVIVYTNAAIRNLFKDIMLHIEVL